MSVLMLMHALRICQVADNTNLDSGTPAWTPMRTKPLSRRLPKCLFAGRLSIVDALFSLGHRAGSKETSW